MRGIISRHSRKPRCSAKLTCMPTPPGSLPHDATLLPHSSDAVSDTVKFVRVSRAEIQQASFLDERLLTPQTEAQLIGWPAVLAALDRTPVAERCQYIFHIGHV